MWCRPGRPVRVGGDGEQVRRVHVRTRLHVHPPAAALSTSQAASCCDLHEPGLAHELMYYGGHHHDLWTTSLLRITSAHQATPPHYFSLSCVDLITLHQFPFKSALCRLRLLNCAMRRRGPAAAAAAVAATPPLPTSPNPTTAPLTSTHQPTSTLPPHYPRYVQGRRLGSSPRR